MISERWHILPHSLKFPLLYDLRYDFSRPSYFLVSAALPIPSSLSPSCAHCTSHVARCTLHIALVPPIAPLLYNCPPPPLCSWHQLLPLRCRRVARCRAAAALPLPFCQRRHRAAAANTALQTPSLCCLPLPRWFRAATTPAALPPPPPLLPCFRCRRQAERKLPLPPCCRLEARHVTYWYSAYSYALGYIGYLFSLLTFY